jgi:hypothetical protein
MEDFMIPFAKTISQQYALSYAEHVMKPERRYLIGGHSEGANLVLYCSAMLGREKQNQIVRICMNDGRQSNSDLGCRDSVRCFRRGYSGCYGPGNRLIYGFARINSDCRWRSSDDPDCKISKGGYECREGMIIMSVFPV